MFSLYQWFYMQQQRWSSAPRIESIFFSFARWSNSQGFYNVRRQAISSYGTIKCAVPVRLGPPAFSVSLSSSHDSLRFTSFPCTYTCPRTKRRTRQWKRARVKQGRKAFVHIYNWNDSTIALSHENVTVVKISAHWMSWAELSEQQPGSSKNLALFSLVLHLQKLNIEHAIITHRLNFDISFFFDSCQKWWK